MDIRKRKHGNLGLERRVRPRADPEPEEIDDVDTSGGEQHSGSEGSSDSSDQDGSDDDEAGDEEDEESGSESEDEGPAIDTSSISFGALARAQASMSRPGRRAKSGKDSAADSKEQRNGVDDGDRPKLAKKRSSVPSRSSKHAPTEMPSSRQVTRRRDVVSTGELGPRRAARDPRFDPAVGAHPGGSSGGRHEERAYAFLDEYRDSEMAQLRAAIRKTKAGSAEREQLQRALKSMEGKRDAKARQERERAVVEEHRRREKELVAQGKKPFYLKKSEQKKRLLLDRFAGMSEKQVEQTIAKRRKKQTAKERLDMPFARRGAE